MHIHFFDPNREANLLAEQAIESLHGATASLEHAVNLVNKLQADIARCRAELTAYASASMELDAQLAELERMRVKEAF